MADRHHRTRLLGLLLPCLVLSLAATQAQSNTPQNLSKPYQKWLDEDVRYIITDQERVDFDKLTTDEQRDKFVEDFWERRNPNPGSVENQFKEEHYRRLAYTNQHFAAGVAGWKTDRGRIYILYGPPDEREQHPGRIDANIPADAPMSVRYPSDVWRYHIPNGAGPGVLFEFIDNCRCGDYQLRSDPTKRRSLRMRNNVLIPVTTIVDTLWKKWLNEDVLYIITDQERADFNKLTTDLQRDDFVNNFWERRNPTPGSDENKFKEEHYRRFAYTNQHFAADVPGWKTDRGRFYIRFGPPDLVDSHPGFSPPSEIWHYAYVEGIGANVVLNFTDECRCGKYQLTKGDAEPTLPGILNPENLE